MYKSDNFYIPDIDELEYYLDPDEDHGLDREGIKQLFSYAMDVWPTDNEVSSTELGPTCFGTEDFGCELYDCKGNAIVYVLFEKYYHGNINAYIDGRLKQYPEEKLLFIIFQETSQIVSKNDDNIIYLDYSDFIRWRHCCELMSHEIVSSKGFAMKTKIAVILKGKSASAYVSFINIFSNSIELFCKTKLIELDPKNNKIKIIDGRMNHEFVGLWCWGVLDYFFSERNRLQWNYFENMFIDIDGNELGKKQIRQGYENYNIGYYNDSKKELSKTVEVNEIPKGLKYVKFGPGYWNYLSKFCVRNGIPDSLKNLLINILSKKLK